MVQDERWLGVLASVSRSLWGEVTPDLRWVSLGLVEDRVVARFAYEGAITEAEHEVVSCAEAEVIADVYPELSTDFAAVHRPVPMPHELEDGTSSWVYVRREPVA